jgi:hypothetical protein
MFEEATTPPHWVDREYDVNGNETAYYKYDENKALSSSVITEYVYHWGGRAEIKYIYKP